MNNRFTKVENRILENFISDPNLYDSLASLRWVMEKIWSNDAPRVINNYTDHGKEHSERVAYFVEKLLQVNSKIEFSELEIYLLLAGVYLHDIGMQCDIVKYPKVKRKAVKLGANFKIDFTSEKENKYLQTEQNEIRENHHYLSAAWIDYIYENTKDPLHRAIKSIPNDLVDDLKDICKFHSKLPINDCPNYFKHNPNSRKKMVAAVLRFADELDICRSRVNIETVMIYSINASNSVFWWIHNCTKVDFVSFNEVLLKIRLHPKDYELYNSVVKKYYVESFINKNQLTLKVLVRNGINVVIHDDSGVISDIYADKFPPEITALLDDKLPNMGKKTKKQGYTKTTKLSKENSTFMKLENTDEDFNLTLVQLITKLDAPVITIKDKAKLLLELLKDSDEKELIETCHSILDTTERYRTFLANLSFINSESVNRNNILVLHNHDLLGHIVSIKGNAEYLEESLTPLGNSEAINVCRSIWDEADGLRLFIEDIISGVIDLERDFNFQRHSLEKVVRKCIKRYEIVASEKGIIIKPQIAPLNITAYIALDEFEIALQNLIHNAIKYSYFGTEEEPRYIDVVGNLSEMEGYYELSISNWGIGIEPDEIENRTIIDRYVRGKLSINIEKDGIGWGLHVVDRVIKKHNGWLDFSSENKGGIYLNIFKVVFPLIHDEKE